MKSDAAGSFGILGPVGWVLAGEMLWRVSLSGTRHGSVIRFTFRC